MITKGMLKEITELSRLERILICAAANEIAFTYVPPLVLTDKEQEALKANGFLLRKDKYAVDNQGHTYTRIDWEE